jgi:tetratricopeptide (TPR) repeat protein
MSKNSTLPKIIRILALVFLIYCLIGLSGCAAPVIKMAEPTPDIIKEYRSVVVWARSAGMRYTGVEVKKGDYITILAEGEINVWPARQGFIKSPYRTLLFRVGEDNIVERYQGPALILVHSESYLYLGYVGSPIDKYGEPKNRLAYQDDNGHFVVDIIVWKTHDPILMANFFEEASQRDPQKAVLKEVSKNFEYRKELFLAEQKAKRELATAEKAIADLQREEVSKPKAPEQKVADPQPIITAVGSGTTVPSEGVSTAKRDTSQNEPTSMPKDPITKGKDSEKIKTTESDINHLIELGQQANKAGRMDEAIELFTEALRHKPQSVEAVNIYTIILLEKGKEAGKAGEMDTAIRVFTDIMRVAPSNPSAYYHRGIAFFSKEQFKEALQDFTEAIRLDSADDLAYIERGVCYYQMDNFQQAIEDFTTAISLKPDNPRAYRNRGSALFGQGDYVSAIRDYDTAISLDTKSPLAYVNRAEAYRKVGRHEDALRDYDKALEIHPDDPEILYNRGLAYWRLKKRNMALTDLRKAANLGFKEARDFLAKQNIR